MTVRFRTAASPGEPRPCGPRRATPSPVGRTASTGALLAGCALLMVGCDDDPAAIGRGVPELRVSPSVVDLGTLYVGDVGRAPIQAVSVGSAPVSWQSRFIGPAAGFVLAGADGRLGVSGRAELELYFLARRAGTFTTRLELLPSGSDAAPLPIEVRVEVKPVPDCEDGNGCTADFFDREAGVCRHPAEDLPCDDFNPCTPVGMCVDGVCRSEGTACDDGDVCTEDLCNPSTGCFHPIREDCDDDNPCTEDRCDPVLGCRSDVLPDGTPCPDQDPCTSSEICLSGQCQTIQVPEGTPCDDGDPCSTDDQCIDGECRDPFYARPDPGELKYATEVGPIAPGGERNPLIGADNGPIVGTLDGVTALDECGAVVWTATTAVPPAFSGAILSPSTLSVPVGGTVVDLDPRSGRTVTTLAMEDALPEGSGDVRVVDMAARASGALVVSATRTSTTGVVQGFLLEVDAAHAVVTRLAGFGSWAVERVAIDQDESLVLLLRDRDRGREQLVRLGIDGVPGGTWSTDAVQTRRSDLGLGGAGEVLWTAGLIRVDRRGDAATLRSLEPALDDRAGGPPVVSGPWVWAVETDALVARTSTGGIARRLPFPAAPAVGPVLDQGQRIYVLDRNGVLRGFSSDGVPLFELPLEPGSSVEGAALALGADGVLVTALGNRVYGIKVFQGLAASPWPKHRRDNFGTSHR